MLLEKRLSAATAQVAELQQKQVEVLAAKHKVEQALMAEKGLAGRQQTVEELKAMIMALHKEVDAREGQLRKSQVGGEEEGEEGNMRQLSLDELAFAVWGMRGRGKGGRQEARGQLEDKVVGKVDQDG